MANDTLRADMVEQVREEQGRKVSRAPRPSRGRSSSASEAEPEMPTVTPVQSESQVDDGPAAEDAPRKRRRRRRSGGAKPAGATDGAADQ